VPGTPWNRHDYLRVRGKVLISKTMRDEPAASPARKASSSRESSKTCAARFRSGSSRSRPSCGSSRPAPRGCAIALDLSCAGGVITSAVLTEYPAAEAYFLDTSSRRLEAARQHFGDLAEHVVFNLAHFADPAVGGDGRRGRTVRPDCLRSGVADPAGRAAAAFYAEICSLLEPGGAIPRSAARRFGYALDGNRRGTTG